MARAAGMAGLPATCQAPAYNTYVSAIPPTAIITSAWLRQHVVDHGRRLFIAEGISVVG
jgi:hypothetical protein